VTAEIVYEPKEREARLRVPVVVDVRAERETKGTARGAKMLLDVRAVTKAMLCGRVSRIPVSITVAIRLNSCFVRDDKVIDQLPLTT
jgi:hypothetical protein